MKDIFEQWLQLFSSNAPDSGIEKLIGCLVVVLVLGILALIIYGVYSAIDWAKATEQNLSGKIIDKKYEGETNTTGTALVSTGTGVGVGMTSSHQDEQFLLFVDASGQIYKASTNMQYFYHCKIGDAVNLKIKVGGISKSLLDTKLI